MPPNIPLGKLNLEDVDKKWGEELTQEKCDMVQSFFVKLYPQPEEDI
jgi:hypothetical protein